MYQAFVITHPEQAKMLLIKHPQLSYALFQALVLNKIVDSVMLERMLASSWESNTGPPALPPTAARAPPPPQHHYPSQMPPFPPPMHFPIPAATPHPNYYRPPPSTPQVSVALAPAKAPTCGQINEVCYASQTSLLRLILSSRQW